MKPLFLCLRTLPTHWNGLQCLYRLSYGHVIGPEDSCYYLKIVVVPFFPVTYNGNNVFKRVSFLLSKHQMSDKILPVNKTVLETDISIPLCSLKTLKRDKGITIKRKGEWMTSKRSYVNWTLQNHFLKYYTWSKIIFNIESKI